VCKNGPEGPAHTALSVREFLASKYITARTPSLFIRSGPQEILKGSHFDHIDDIRSNMAAALKAIPQTQFQNCLFLWLLLPQFLVYKTTHNIPGVYWGPPNQY
jgi:hypothetical protein